jgi:hypothetical protein
VICTLFTVQKPVRRVFLCAIVLNSNWGVLIFTNKVNGHHVQMASKNIEDFHSIVRRWARAVDANGPEVLKHSNFNRTWTYIDYYNNRRIQKKTKWMPPAKYSMASIC